MRSAAGQQLPRGPLARLADRRVGSLAGETGRVAATTHAFLLFAFLLSFGYTIFFMFYDAVELAPVVIVSLACALAFAVALVLVRMGHQLTASLLGLTTPLVQIFVVTRFVGWETGLHLYLLAGGQLVFMVFTQRQRVLRVVFAALAVLDFVYVQLVVPEEGFSYAFSPAVLAYMFPANATLTLILVYVLAAVTYHRSTQARQAADESAARAEYLANTDALTGLSNRRPVLERLESLSATGDYALAIADLDHFKTLNDTYGHTCGDHVLHALGERMRTQLRSTDAVGRWGGEEFIFVMANATIGDAVAMMERMRATIERHPVPCSGHSHEVTMSVGVAAGSADRMAHRVIKRADDALYEAKQAGRNCVRVAIPPEPVDEPEREPGSRTRRTRR